MASPAPRASASPSEALYTPLGYSQHGSEAWLHIRVDGVERVFRPSQALGLGFLLQLVPDLDHWRRMFPSRTYNGRKVDWYAACTCIIRACRAAGELTT